MNLELKNKRALVTGSSAGIGAGIAKTLAAEGANVIIHGRNAARANKVADEIRATGGDVAIALGDLATVEGCQSVGDTVMEKLGGLDILVNNAGGMASAHRGDTVSENFHPTWLDTPWDDWLWTFEQNVGAAVRLIKRFAPGMKEQGWGRIINIASAAATQSEPDLADYQPAKAALVNLTSGLAKSLAHTGITVNTVSPGTILTETLRETFGQWAKQLGKDTSDWSEIERFFTTEVIPQPINHFGRPEDIGRMVTLLASPLSGYMTGANYRVDGGQCRSIN